MTYMKILLLLMFCTVLPMQAQQMKKLTDLKDFEARLLQEAKNIESIESNFTQIKYLDVFDEKITSKGKFYYKKSNKICMDYAQPMNYLIVINNNQLKIVSDGKKSIMDLHSNKMMNQMQDMLTACMVGDLSAVVTGILLSFVCPVDLPWWVIIIGAFFSIVVVKQLYGGIGCNFLNPALAGRAFLLASYATWMTTWAIPQIRPDVTSAATPMAIMKEGTEEAFTTLMSNYSIGDMFLGKVGGSLGEVSALCLLVGGVYLLIRKVISWQIPVAYIGTVAILTLIAAPAGIDNVQYMLYNVFGGGLMLGAIFMATDYATSPVTKPGQLIFGLGCGLLTCFIRRFGSYPEGVCYSILIMNCTTWLLDKYIRPVIYGAPKKEKKEAAK